MQTTQPTSKFIKELRFRLSMTQEQFAMELGVTISTIQRWENEITQPSPMAMNNPAASSGVSNLKEF